MVSCSTFKNLLEVVPNKRKAEYLLEVIKAFSQVDEQWLRKGALMMMFYEWLTDIKGIGDWSANFVMIRGLGRMEKISMVGPDLALDAGRIYNGKDQPMTDENVCNLAEKYGNWKGYWAYYLRIYANLFMFLKKAKSN